MACIETFSTLLIFSKDITPESIGNRLGVNATDMRLIDPDSKYRHRRERHRWKWCTEGIVESTRNLDHLHAILDLLKGKASVLEELRLKGCDMEIANYWDSTGQGGPYLDLNTMRALVELGLEISWDIYFDDESET